MKVVSANVFIIIGLSQLFTVQTKSPCPDIFEYKNDENGMYGIITLKPSGNKSMINIKTIFTFEGKLDNNYLGDVKPCDVQITQVIYEYNRGNSIRYRVNFPVVSSLPKITGIYVNDDLVCSNDPEPPRPSSIVTIITLQHNLFAQRQPTDNVKAAQRLVSPFLIRKNAENIDDNETITGNKEYTSTDKVYPCSSIKNQSTLPSTQLYITDEVNLESKPEDLKVPKRQIILRRRQVSTHDFEPPLNEECGKPNPLPLGGYSDMRGDWPWIVAIFERNLKSSSLNFLCSGSLISGQHVVTAALCIKDKKTKDIVMKLGVFDLDDWIDGVFRTLKSAIVHEGFNSKNAENNIALLTMDKAVQFNKNVRPVCLWGSDSNLNHIVGANGVVLGWRANDQSRDLGMIRLPIVSTQECRASNSIFHHITSENTLCAGNRDGNGPCSGDPGSGLYVLEGGRWTLRGIISLIVGKTEKLCSTEDYTVFVDAAKYTSWIQTHMQF